MKAPTLSRIFFCAIVVVSMVFLGTSKMDAQDGDAKKSLVFEVATVKPGNPSNMVPTVIRVYPGGRLSIREYSVRGLIAAAFNVPGWEVVGGEKWVSELRFDIEGKSPEELGKTILGGEYSNSGIQNAGVRSMLQALLLERFQLRFHMDSQPGTVYLLKRGDGPLRLKSVELQLYNRAEDGTVTASDAYPTGDTGMVSGKPITLYQTSMHQLASVLSNIQRAPVKDQTGLTDFYNFRSQVIVTEEDFKSGSPMRLLVEAVPEMGLKLVKTEGAVEKLIIDSVEMPLAN